MRLTPWLPSMLTVVACVRRRHFKVEEFAVDRATFGALAFDVDEG